MWLKSHLLFTIIPAIAIVFFNPIYALVFFISGVIIDLDHVFLLKKEKLSLNPLKVHSNLLDESKKRMNVGGLVILPLHFIEVWLVLLLVFLISRNNFILAIIAGVFYHLALDAIHWSIKSKKMKVKRKRIFLFLQYLYYKKYFAKREPV